VAGVEQEWLGGRCE